MTKRHFLFVTGSPAKPTHFSATHSAQCFKKVIRALTASVLTSRNVWEAELWLQAETWFPSVSFTVITFADVFSRSVPNPYVFSRSMCRANQLTCYHVSLEHSRANDSNSNSFFVRTVQLLSNQLPFCCFPSQYNVDSFKRRENSQLTCRIQTSVRSSAVACLFVCLFFYKIKRHSFSNALQFAWYKLCLGWIIHKTLHKSTLVATLTTSLLVCKQP